MSVNIAAYKTLKAELDAKGVTLVAVSKTKPAADILALYDLGQRDFGENYVQELLQKKPQLPQDIRWHFIGHLQRNKIKQLAPFVHLIHGVDAPALLQEGEKQGAKCGRVLTVLLQVHIASEETKFGFEVAQVAPLLQSVGAAPLPHVRAAGLMGMASNTADAMQVQREFATLAALYAHVKAQDIAPAFQYLSMGMSGDYAAAIAAGSNMVRIGSLLFGARE